MPPSATSSAFSTSAASATFAIAPTATPPAVTTAAATAETDVHRPDPHGRRAARVLAVCQALYTSSVSIDLTLTGLVGYTLADDKALATLPFSLITVAAALTTIFASFLMARVGRRAGFMLGAGVGALGGAVSVWAIFHHSFWAFCAGTATVGVFQAFAQYYRLAAADAVGMDGKSRAISTVLTGGVVAAVCGPLLAAWSKDWLTPVAFAGSYVLVTGFGLVSIALLALLYRDAAPFARVTATHAAARPLGDIVRQPIFAAALANNALGYAVMMFVMTATPIAAVACGHTIGDGAAIIQWHLVGMYAPSLFSARLIGRFGVLPVIGAGIGLSALCGVFALRSTDLPHFYAALACLGVGWNFMFVGGSTLLAQSYRPSERAKTQATSEFTTFAFSALGSLFAGQLLTRFGWATINAAIFPLLGIAALATLAYAWSRKQAAAEVVS
ncbi:MFS transporter [Paraburkholderia sp. 22099]|uniref:Predicted arabinose efflux permease, MFS family n=1 Tax=Paraburkholderia terricola TaxID=169427 RepID=A0A1M6JTQ8_9BURK|nr:MULTISPECIES: MFS transporter [Paraburkholderia]SDN66086.1 Predicted arabinose efflux permease, MFS family [Paraburkholderia sediminicola]SHJ50078.1 Predicted arabinose efflux permease, MFS family [Paraburkholderia terricola]